MTELNDLKQRNLFDTLFKKIILGKIEEVIQGFVTEVCFRAFKTFKTAVL